MQRTGYQGSAEWHAERRKGIGSSDAPRVLGVSRWGTILDVWREKVSDEQPEPTSAARLEQQELGLELEHAIAKTWAARVGKKVRRHHRLVWAHGSVPMFASLDFEVVGESAVLEVKTRRSSKGFGEPGTATVPDDVWAQVQHQMFCAGKGKAYVVAMIAGAPPREYVVERDDEFLATYVMVCEDLWTDHVLTGEQPPFDGSEGGDRILAKKYPESTGEVIATPEAEVLVGLLQDARRRKAEVEAEEATIIQRIKDFIGAKERLIGPGFRISHKWSKPASKVSWPLVAGELANLLRFLFPTKEEMESHGVDIEAIIAAHTTENKAARPFVVEFDEEMD